MKIKSGFAILAAATALAAIATPSFAEKEKKKGPDPRIGKQVNRICFPRNINGWKTVKGEDNVVLLEEGVNDWYYVKVSGGCDERLFRFAHVIGIDSGRGGGCLRRGDSIIVEDTGSFSRRCYIKRIYEWDDKAPAPSETPPSEEDAKS